MSHETSSALRVQVTLLVVAALVVVGFAIQHTLSCLLLAFIAAYLLDPFVVILERRRVGRPYGILALYGLIGLVSLFFFTFAVPVLVDRWNDLLAELPAYVHQLRDQVSTWKLRFGPAAVQDEWRWLADAAFASIDKGLGRMSSVVYTTLTQVFFNLFNLLLAPILVLFMLLYKKHTAEAIVTWIPVRHRDKILALGRDIDQSIGGFIRGQIVVSLIVALLSTCALVIFQVNHPLLSGIFAGIASVIPFVGVIIATIPALFFAYVQYQSGLMLLKVAVSFAIIYFLEGYIIKPLVFKEAMNLNPLVTIVAVMVCGELLGFWGILLAIPLAAAVKIIADHIQLSQSPREP